MRVMALRTLVIGAEPLRLNMAELAMATVRAASTGSASTRRIASSIGQSGLSSASCTRKAALTLVGNTNSPRMARAATCPNASSLFMTKIITQPRRQTAGLCEMRGETMGETAARGGQGGGRPGPVVQVRCRDEGDQALASCGWAVAAPAL